MTVVYSFISDAFVAILGLKIENLVFPLYVVTPVSEDGIVNHICQN